jgi:hypothetical protein
MTGAKESKNLQAFAAIFRFRFAVPLVFLIQPLAHSACSYPPGYELREKSRNLFMAVGDANAEPSKYQFYKCGPVTPRTKNTKAIGISNWYLTSCGPITLVQKETYLPCDPKSFSSPDPTNDYMNRLLSIMGQGACLSVDYTVSNTYIYRDYQGKEFRLLENNSRARLFEESLGERLRALKCETTRSFTSFQLNDVFDPSGREFYLIRLSEINSSFEKKTERTPAIDWPPLPSRVPAGY